MNLKEAKQVLKENGYELTFGQKLIETAKYLGSQGYVLYEAAVSTAGDADSGSEDDDSDEGDASKEQDNDVQGTGRGKEVKGAVKTLVTKLRDIDDYDTFVNTLKNLKPEQRKLLTTLVGEGKYAKNTERELVSIPVKILHPTQSEIDLNNSLAYPLKEDPSGMVPILKGDEKIVINKSPIVIYKAPDGKYYIIDGHHRWSQVFLLNPTTTMKAYLYTAPEKDEDPVDVLRDFQLVIKAITGKVQVATADKKYNIYGLGEDQIRSYIDGTITEDAIKTWQSVDTNATKDSITNYLVKNALRLKTKNGPAEGAPERGVMPQTSPKTLRVAAQGMTDV